MTRQQLEAVIWRAAPDLVKPRDGVARGQAMNVILDAVERYAARRAVTLADAKLTRDQARAAQTRERPSVTARRRAELEQAVRKAGVQ